ncbi:DUF4123 domain-containing protein [Pseudomonas sp. RTB3]|uniref:DUF4123 domain-containing protein n=1 Tax=unclassified Pseudomonas TaxID=196821 RepID=UPI002B23AB3D|nr:MULTISPECIES: DUF4123 domain-containing protein [unclassified Pseudomonas]MEB0007556.1 DUF4123 domain-containing protein [Pseudomonas sp. RTB2]MEB0018529.1 DUF4123 domain-containing protein [Pseudomonas sp. RTB3]MEB0270586.1 DUF4123 domain-containing protein [Pseudomonas sp. 5B4]
MGSATAKRIALPEDFPWQQSVGLLLDAVQVEKLLPRLFEWAETPRVDVLYLTTRLAEFRDLSPCLVRLKGAGDPALAQFLENVDQLWGFLLVSDEPWEQVVAHLRWLTVIEHPSGQEMLLRMAYPPVADALFGTEYPDSMLFGPCQHIFTVDLARSGWHRYTRPGEMPPPKHDAPYRFNEKQWDSLDDASFRKRVTELSRHMKHYFPDYQAELTDQQYREHLQALARRAVEHGFDCEKELYLYANAHGFVDEQGLRKDPDIVSLLDPKSSSPKAQRIERIADLAQKRCLP